MRIYLTLLFVLLFPLEGRSESLDLDGALRRALTHNKSIAVLQNKLDESTAVIGQTRAAFLPSLGLGGNFSYVSRVPELELDFDLPVKLPDIEFARHHTVEVGLQSSYLLYDWGKRNHRQRIAEIGAELTELSLRALREEITCNVIKTYAAAALRNDQLALVKRFVEISKEHLSEASEKHENGLISEFDLLQSQIRVETYHQQYAIANSEREITLLSLAELCGAELNEVVAPKEELMEITLDMPHDLDFDLLIDAREDILRLEKKQEFSRQSSAIAALRPSLLAKASAGVRNNFLPETDKLLINATGALSLTFPLFDGGLSRYRREEELKKQGTYQKEIDRVTSETNRRLKILKHRHNAAQAEIRIAQDKLTLARKVLDIAVVSFNSGLITNAQFLDTELDVQRWEIEQLAKRYNLLLLKLDLKKELGYFPELKPGS